MQMVQNAFFCTTPYQIITSIVLNQQFCETSDIYIVPQFRFAEEYADRLREIQLFNRVKLVDLTDLDKHKKAKNKLLLHVGIVQQYFNVDKIAESFLFPNTEYERIYVSSKAFVPRMAYLYCVKHGKKTELVYYDDGEGSYYNRYRIEPSSIDHFIRRVMFGKKANDHSGLLYLYEPELYKALNGNHWNGTIIQIPHIITEPDIKEKLSKVFGITEEDRISENVIILDVLKNGKYSAEDIKKLLDIYGRIQQTFGYENTIVKRHPRNKTDELKDFKCYERYTVPFECLCTQMDMEKKILIVVSSTAVIIPKLLIGQEPVVILLYRIINQINQNDEYKIKQDNFYKLCKSNYSSSNKFYIPNSLQELDDILKYLSKEIDNSRG